MSTVLIITLIIVVIIIMGAIGWIGTYNDLIRRRNWVTEAFAQVDVQLQRRNDLIPNLVNTVKGYANHESSTLVEVTTARQQLINLPEDATAEQINAMSNQLSSALSRLMAISERYPELKANANFSELQSSLETIEKEIAVARQLYNSSVIQYNNAIQVFPSNIIAGVHGFHQEKVLETVSEARAVPTVNFE